MIHPLRGLIDRNRTNCKAALHKYRTLVDTLLDKEFTSAKFSFSIVRVPVASGQWR